jgi:tetratricopeptide (TPR) repeat protein
VGPYPLELATAYPPESNPNPFQPVASVAIEAIELPAELHWQPAEVQRNGRIELGTEIGCNYVLTRVWSAAEQEVALQLGDDDNLRALVNGELRLETKPNRGAAHPGEHAVAATLKPGWNTILLKVRNASEKSNVVLQLSDASDDLIAARRGSRIYQADRLAAAGKADEALTLLTELIDENPKDDTLYAKRAEACQQLKQWEDAVRDWTRALEWNPDDLRYLRERAQILDWRLRRLEEALLDWNRLVELTPEDPNAWRLRSQCYDSLGQTEQAMTDINRAVALSSPGNLWLALRVRGDYLARKGKWQEAADDFNKAFGTEVGQWARFDVYRSQAVLQLMAGNVEGYQAAIDKLDEHLANDANSDRTTALVLAIIATPVEITPERRDRLLQSLERKAPGDDEGLKRWLTAALHYRAGEYQQAADLFAQDATRRGLPAFQLLAAMAQHQLGNQAQAKQLLDETAAWIQRKEDSEAGPAVPANQNWHNWAICNILEREAAALIGGQ